jgi:S-adenosylmethionine-diacylgycerolhomoserine-N-methlytransferase
LLHWCCFPLRAWLRQFHVTPRANLESVLRTMIKGLPYRLEFSRHAFGYAWIAIARRF